MKLAGTLGGLLGWWGWWTALYGLLTGFILGGLVAAVLLVSRRADRTSHLSFGPALIAGAYIWAVLPPLCLSLAPPARGGSKESSSWAQGPNLGWTT